MKFLNAGGEFDHRPHTRTYAAELGIAFSALDCVLNGRKAVYASSPLTTGNRALALMRAHGVTDTSDLRAHLGEAEYRDLLWNPNVSEAVAFAERIRVGSRHELVITPAPFMAPGWNQDEYLAFWERLIRTRVELVYFNDGWQYSSGCVFEFAVALDEGVPTLDSAGNSMAPDEGRRLAEVALKELEEEGLASDLMKKSVELNRCVSGKRR